MLKSLELIYQVDNAKHISNLIVHSGKANRKGKSHPQEKSISMLIDKKTFFYNLLMFIS